MRRSLRHPLSHPLALALAAAVAAPSLHAQSDAQTAPQGTRVTKRASAPVGATPTETAGFVVRLGADTTTVERWTRTLGATGGRLEGDVFNRAPVARVTHYAIDLDARGLPTRAEIRTRRPDGTPIPNGALGSVYTFRGDSAFAEVQTADSVARYRTAAPPGTIPSLAGSYAMWETALRPMRTAGRDSVSIALWSAGAPRTQGLATRFVGRDATEAEVDYFGDPVALRFDRDGRLLAVDGSRTTNKSVAERVADVDVAAIARSFAARPTMGQTSPRDTVRAMVGSAQLLVDYGRPSRRGRTVWGGVLVPPGTVWRTGANAATHFRTSTDLAIGGQAVPAGTYTLYTMPVAGGYQLVINKQVGQWGTEYKPEMDLVRVPLTASVLSAPVEQFTIAIEPAGTSGGALHLRWDTTQLAVPFVVK